MSFEDIVGARAEIYAPDVGEFTRETEDDGADAGVEALARYGSGSSQIRIMLSSGVSDNFTQKVMASTIRSFIPRLRLVRA